jgi:hypothetical protein
VRHLSSTRACCVPRTRFREKRPVSVGLRELVGDGGSLEEFARLRSVHELLLATEPLSVLRIAGSDSTPRSHQLSAAAAPSAVVRSLVFADGAVIRAS